MLRKKEKIKKKQTQNTRKRCLPSPEGEGSLDMPGIDSTWGERFSHDVGTYMSLTFPGCSAEGGPPVYPEGGAPPYAGI
jgi:hypothetical protein